MAYLEAMESLFSDKLNSNYVPNDDEVSMIKELLVEPDQKLHDITGEIEEVKAQLEKLLKEKEDLNEQLKAHKALLSPARRLPPNVIQQILLTCLPLDRNPVLSGQEAPLLLGRICSQWRDIALATPKLWASLHIAIPADPPVPMPPPIGGGNPPPNPQTDHSTRIQAITAWLSRSDPFPLSISVYNSRFDNVAGNAVQLYLDTILSFAPRWKHIHMSVPHQVWNNFLPRIRANDVPILEKIYFDSSMGYHGVPGSPGTGQRRDSGVLKAPNLRSVSLIQFEPHILHLPLRWNRLVELNLSGSIPTWQPVEGLSITETLAILTLCPNLEYFSVQFSLAGFTPLVNGEDGLPDVALNKLLGLAITETNNLDCAAFLRHLTTPSLRYMKFRRTSPNSYITPPDLNQSSTLRAIHIPLALFLRRIGEPLEEFELDALYMTETDVMKCLSLMPGLKKLSLWSYGSSGAPASPYGTPASVAPWENSLFTFEDRHLKRFVPGLKDEPDVGVSNPSVFGWGPAFVPAPPVWALPPPLPAASLQTVQLPVPQPAVSWIPAVDDGSASNVNQDDDPTTTETSGSNAATETANSELGTQNTSSNVDTPTASAHSPASTPPPLPASLSKDKGKARATEAENDDEPVIVDTFDVLCPLLEEFRCSGAVFSDDTMLAFLHARSSLASKPLPSSSGSSSSKSAASTSASESSTENRHNLARLRRCRISYSIGREENDEIKDKLDEIRKETGMYLDVHYPPVPMSAYYRKYSPYDGLPSVPVLGAAPGSNANGGVNTISTTGGLGAGEPVFLYSAAFH